VAGKLLNRSNRLSAVVAPGVGFGRPPVVKRRIALTILSSASVFILSV
jgi:hypothetical protein